MYAIRSYYVRDAVGSETKLRLDANGGWNEREAARAIARFAPYQIEFLEQPVDARNLGGLARLSALPAQDGRP